MHRILAACLALAPGFATAATFTTFDYPGATTTCATAMARNGAIAGLARSGTALSGSKAFIYINGHFTTPNLPLPGVTEFTAINSALDVTGFVLESQQVGSYAFLAQGGKVSTPSVAGATLESLLAVNDRGALLGDAVFSGSSFPVTNGFIQQPNGRLTMLSQSGAMVYPRNFDETATIVVGTSASASGITAWSFTRGGFMPVAYPGGATTFPAAVNSKGTIWGSYTDSTGAAAVHGFIETNGAYQSFDVPGAASTEISAANESGQFAGCYSDAHGRQHGFLVTP